MATTKLTLPTELDPEKFISVQAHDLRTPFNHITGFSKMLINTLTDAPLTDFQKEDLGTVYRSGMRALLLMNGLIDIARLNRKEAHFDIVQAQLKPALEAGMAFWKKFNPETDTQLELRPLAACPTLPADEQMFKQIVSLSIGYVNNFTESKAKVTIGTEEEGKWLVLTFSSVGLKSNHPSELDMEMMGFLVRAFIELHRGEVRRAEENDDGAILELALPKA
jgi:signal transduction histidine kinase